METVVIMVILAILVPGLAVPFAASRHPANNFSSLQGGDESVIRPANSLIWDESSHTPVEGVSSQYREDQVNGDQEPSQLLPAPSEEDAGNQVVHDTSDDDSSLRNDDNDNDGDGDDEDDDEEEDDDDYDRESESDDVDEDESDEFVADRDQLLPTDEATADSVNQ